MKKNVFAILLCAVMMLAMLAACGPAADPASTDTPASAAPTEETTSGGGDAGTGLMASDLTGTPDVTIAFGDYDGMNDLATEIQNGRATGQVVQIDGTVSNFSAGMSYNITERNAEDTGSIGTTFKIEDAAEADYPSDGTHVQITGKVVQDPEQPLSFYIATLPEFVEVLD